MINRILKNRIAASLRKGKAVIVYGPRQCGKTTLVKSMLEESGQDYFFINGDEPDVRDVLPKATSTALRSMIGRHTLVFIDEAQRIPEIGIVIKLFVDQMPDVQVIATGSSSFELASRTQEPLTGRKYEFLLLPFSFEELTAHEGMIQEKRQLENRLIYGLYPEVVTKPAEQAVVLKLLAGSYLYKDILMSEQLKKPGLLEKILRALALQIGNEVSYHEIAQLVGADIQTIEKYIILLEQAFVLFRLPAFSRNVRNEIKKGKKVFFVDNGIRNAVLGNFSPLHVRTDVGMLWENYLMSERYKLHSFHGYDVTRYFWRTTQQQEIDYIEERSGTLYVFEFKWNSLSKLKIPKTFLQEYHPAASTVVTPKTMESFLLEQW